MSNLRPENHLLRPILDQVQALVSYTHLQICGFEGAYLTPLAYRGPLPVEQALLMSFPLARVGGARRVMDEMAPVLIPDVWADAPLPRSFRLGMDDVPLGTFSYIASWIGLPLFLDGRVAGMLDVAHSQPNFYTPAHVACLAGFLKEAAGSIENALLHTQLTHRSEEMETLYAVQQAISARLEMPALLQLVADEARRLTSARQVHILLSEGNLTPRASSGDASRLTVAFGTDNPSAGPVDSAAFETPAIAPLLETAGTWWESDASDDLRLTAAARQLGARSLMIVPLRGSIGFLGALVATDKVYGAFGPNDERLMNLLAAGAAVALENARLYHAEQEGRRRVEITQRILALLSAHRGLEETLAAILECAGELFGADAGAIVGAGAARHGASCVTWVRQNEDQALVERAGSEYARLAERAGARVAMLDLNDVAAENPDEGAWRVLASTFRRALVISLAAEQAECGCIALFCRQPRRLCQAELELAETVGQHVALALERDELARKADDLSRLQERQRIAQALHDTVAQLLFRIGLEADWLQKLTVGDEATRERGGTIQRLTARSVYELRSAIFALSHAEAAGPQGLIDLLRAQVVEFQEVTGIQCTLIAPADLRPVSPAVAEALYRIAREALTNVHKHAAATAVLVSLQDGDQALTLTIQDNGIGLGPTSTPNINAMHFGVNTMRLLAMQLGGALQIEDSDEQGARVRARLPLQIDADGRANA